MLMLPETDIRLKDHHFAAFSELTPQMASKLITHFAHSLRMHPLFWEEHFTWTIMAKLTQGSHSVMDMVQISRLHQQLTKVVDCTAAFR